MAQSLETLIHPIGTALWLMLGAFGAGHAIMYKRDPKGAGLWVFVCFTLPIVGPWIYWTFGINRIERRAKRRIRAGAKPSRKTRTARDGEPEPAPPVGHLEPLRRIGERVTRFPLVPGNAIEPLHHGERAFPAMLEAIASARRSVTLASFIFDWDEVGQRFVDALAGAARRGVRVHALLDGLGAVRSFSRIGRALIQSGAHVAAFFPLRFPFGRARLHLRYHGKLLIVDGTVGFTGGMNVSARHLMDRPNPNRAEDLHFRLRGPIVSEMQHAFREEWLLATHADLAGEAYFPRQHAAGTAWCRAILSGPDENLEKIHWFWLGGLGAARYSVHIATPYFIPSRALIESLSMAALRGVDVTLILPSKVDHRFMRWAADAYLWQLLEHGIHVVRRPPPFVHTKLMIIDRRWLLFGSANMDRRSFRLNFEFNIEAYDAPLAETLATWLDDVVRHCHRVTLEEMDARPPWKRLRDGTVKLFSPYL